LKSIEVELFNGKKQTVGITPSRGPDASYEFAPGETIVGDIELCGNGIGSRTGRISFTTSKNQKFEVGDEHTPYYFPSGNSFLTGFFGQAGDDIDHLGILMMKPILNAEIRNVHYPTLNGYAEGLSPKIYKSSLCNDDNNQSQVQEVTFSKTVGTSYTWTIGVSFTFGGSISVEAGLPGIEKVSAEFHWEVGISSSYSRTVDTTHSQTMDFPVTVPPRERIFATFSWWDSTCNVPYTADLFYTFSDRSNYTFAIQDMYTGAYITNVVGDYHSVVLNRNESCSGIVV